MKVYRDSLIKCNNPGGDSYWEGGQPKIYGYNNNEHAIIHTGYPSTNGLGNLT